MTFCDNLLKSFSENLKQLTKMNDFLLFLRFHENRRILHYFYGRYDFLLFWRFHENCRILHCFHGRYEFCMQKYPSKCIFIEFP